MHLTQGPWRVDEGYSSQQNTDTIAPFRINQANGMLTPTGQVIKTNSPCGVSRI